MLSFFVSAVIGLVTWGVGNLFREEEKKAAKEEEATVATKTADDLERDAKKMLDRATKQADYYDDMADALMEGYETNAENLDRKARDQEAFIKEQLQRIIGKQRVGIAGSGFKVKSATTEVLAEHSTDRANKDIAQMWENTEGEKTSLYNEMIVDYNTYKHDAETLRTTSQEDYDTMIEDAEWWRDRADDLLKTPKDKIKDEVEAANEDFEVEDYSPPTPY
jgi:hypothetical protein